MSVRTCFVYWIYQFLRWSWRIQWQEDERFCRDLANHRPVILAHWHGDELALLHVVKGYRLATLTSTSRDGQLMSELLQRLGAVVSRGSSTRSGSAGLRGLMRLCQEEGLNASLAVDGPQGPAHVIKPGIFQLSRLMDMPIYALSAETDRAWIFAKSWNKAFLPKPFARVRITVRWVMPAVSRNTDPRDQELAVKLATVLVGNEG